MLPPDKKADELIERLKRKIEVSVIVICIVVIVLCCIYAYIVRPIKDGQVKSSIQVGYEKFKSFSLPLGDTTGTEAYEEETISERTDNWGIRYIDKQRIK
jgi:hypothetical protein